MQDGAKDSSSKNGSEKSSKNGKGSGGDGGDGAGGGSDAPTPDFGKSFPPRPTATSDDVRLSCRKMLATALKGRVILISLHPFYNPGTQIYV